MKCGSARWNILGRVRIVPDIDEVEMMIFLGFLLLSAAMDIKEKALDSRFLIIMGLMGILSGGISGFGGRNLWEILLSSGIGFLLLLLSKLTGGGIGEGDGWFFAASGLFLSAGKNMSLLLSGLFLCSIYSLGVAATACFRGKRSQKSFPFLPFLIPGGVWVICMK